jgi:hypothetical protein
VGEYIGRGQTVTPATTIQGIVLYLRTPMTQGTAALPPTIPHTYPPDPTHRALKLYVNALTEFSGQPIESEQWVLAARATLGQTVYGKLLENPPPPGDVIMETRNKELFHMLVTAFMHGSGMYLLQVTLVADDGHAAFNSIKEWYGSAATSQSIIDHYQKKLEVLKLDANTTASDYVNVFQICCQKLEAKNEGYTTDKKKRFLNQIFDDDDDVVKQNLQGNSDLAFDDCVRHIQQREQDLQIDAGESLKKARRFKKDDAKLKLPINLQKAKSQAYQAIFSTR